MIPLTAAEAAQALGVARLPGSVTAVSIDTRTLRPGDLFVALRGERFDGHDFVERALAAGALAAVVARDWWESRKADGAKGAGPNDADGGAALSVERMVPVDDTLEALGGLARAVRRKSGAKVIAVTGSVGKTGTKDLIAAMARRVGPVVATAANQNNEIGVPLTLLSLAEDTGVAVVEMGMRGTGQIAALARVAEPDVGVITNVHPVHLELLGSLQAIAEAKAELILGLRPDCTAVVPAASEVLAPLLPRVSCRVLRFTLGTAVEAAEVRGVVRAKRGTQSAVLSLRWPQGEAEVEVPFVSRHRLENLVAAFAACLGAGLPAAACLQGVADVVFTPSRGDVSSAGEWVVVNDTYNANPAAVRAALDDVVALAEENGGRAVAVLGDMLELGPDERRFHAECGAYAAQAGVRVLWGVGPLSEATADGFRVAAHAGQTVGHVESVDDVGPVVASLRPGDVILFKASRSVRLETMVSAVVDAARADAPAAPGGESDES